MNVQLDIGGIENEKFGVEVANAGTNLPGGQRILVSGIVADEQHGFRLVELTVSEESAARSPSAVTKPV